MTIVFPTAQTLWAQPTLVDSIDASTSNTDNLVVLADTDISPAREGVRPLAAASILHTKLTRSLINK